MLQHVKNNPFLVFSYTGILLLFFFNIENSFFWDTIQLGSRHASFFLSANFSTLLLPDYIDSGHIPAFGFYLGLTWKFFGRTLLVSHLAMLPFVLGIVWQLYKLATHFFHEKHVGLVALLLLLDPTLLSQMTLVSPDVPLVFFFLMGMNALLNNKKKVLAASVLFLFLISMRGMMVSFCLLLLDVYCNVLFSKQIGKTFAALLKRSTIYLPALLVFISFSLFHYFEKGWIGFHDDSPWAECFEPVDAKGFMYNITILGWRVLDFGRLGIWFVFMVLFLKYRKHILNDKQARLLVIIFICLAIVLPANMLWAKNLLAHRYLIPIYLVFSLLAAKVLFSDYVNKTLKKAFVFVWLLVLLTGNLWVYPIKIAQGWDSTLAHLPYYKLRSQAIEYMDNQNININGVGTFFPNAYVLDDVDLSKDYRAFKSFTGEEPYVFYSNVYNVKDQNYNIIVNNYEAFKKFSNKTVYIQIFKRKNL